MDISFVWIFYKAGNILENAVYLFVQWIYCQIYYLSTFKELNEAPYIQHGKASHPACIILMNLESLGI